MNIQPADILICRGHSWISRAILRVTKGEWSHAAIATSMWGQMGVIEAQKNGVNTKLWSVWRKKWNYDFVVFRYTAEFSEKEMMVRGFSKCGETDYDFSTFFIRIPRRLFGGKAKENKKADEAAICSEFCAWFWDLKILAVNPYEVTPQELYDYLLTRTDFVQIPQ